MRQREYGTEMSRKIKLRLAALGAATALSDFLPANSGAERCHELTADLAGHFSIDLKHPYRLLFVPVGLEAAEFSSERARWDAIKAVEIVSIEDTHG